MAVVVLPSVPAPRDMTVTYVDWGGTLRPALGGPAQRLNRLGTRHRVEFTMPPMTVENARIWVQRLKRGVHDGARIEFPQPGLNIGSFPAVVCDPFTGGSSITIRGLPANYVVEEGRYLSIFKLVGLTNRHFLYSINATQIADPAGVVTVGLTPMLRRPEPLSAFVFLGGGEPPMIEGTLTGDEQSWTVNAAHHYGLTFGIEEDE